MPAPYYILIPGGPLRGAPCKAHASIEAAQTEAKRLHELHGGTLLVRILETAIDLDATHIEQREGKPLPRVVYKKRRIPAMSESQAL
ncbi:MAG: hypothetical protein WAW75_10140 [Gallionella sp.]